MPEISLFSKTVRSLPARSLRAALGALLAGLCALPFPLTAAFSRPLDREEEEERAEGKTAPAEEKPGETLDAGSLFPLQVVPERAKQSKDPAIAALAARILDGSADLRDRRAWHFISLLYAPFEALPPAGWRAAALSAGAAISIEARKRAAQLAAARAGGGGSSGLPSAGMDDSGETDAATAALGGSASTASADDAPFAPLASYAWSPLGPTNYTIAGAGDFGQGRATALWVHPTNTNFILAGFADGGVWKTTNGGTTWTPISDFEVSTSIGSLDVLIRTDTVNLTDAIIYVGLGEGNTASDSVDGGGILKSVNGGATWALQSIPWTNPDAASSARFRHSVRRIVIDTNVANAQSVWVAGDGGVYHTSNGGANWLLDTNLPYTGKPGVGGCWPEMPSDFVIDNTVSPSRLYVAFGARSNASSTPALSCTGVGDDVNFRKNNGIFRSLDGGASWVSITGAGTGFPAVPGKVGRITLLQAPSNKKQIYALIACVTNGASTCSGGQFASLGIFRTTDASIPAVSWTAGSTTNFCANQGWFDLTGAVDPTNPAKLFVAGLDSYLSTDSGSTITRKSLWTSSGTGLVHADQHHTVFANATTVFIACDGGIFKGTVSGTTVTWTNLNSGGLQTLQFYGIGQHPTTANRIHGGLQDNGEAYTATGGTWASTMGGDGGFSATDWTNGELAYEEYVYGGISRSTTGGAGSWSCIQNFGGCSGCGICIPDGQASFVGPMQLDANNPSIMYAASKYVYRNTSAPSASTWTAISPDLVGTTYDYIVNVHSAPNNGVAGTIWAATLNGRVWVTTDNAANWTNTTASPLPNNPVLPNRAATWVTTHPADGRKAIVTFSGWNGSGSQPGHVFRTLNGGATWADISGALPDEPVFTVTVDPARPNDVYIGTEYGVYVNTAGWSGTTWTKINAGSLPNVHVNQLEFSRANGKLRAATHGRGIWELTVACPAFTPPTLAVPTLQGCGAKVSWTPSGSTGTLYNVYRSHGLCPGSGGFVPIATGISGTEFVDTGVSGGQSYSYKVTTSESAGSCESAASNCQGITISGACPCTEPPAFAGVSGVTTPFNASCSLSPSWSAGSQVCGASSPVYNVYRSTSAGFTPSASNRIATCVPGTSFTDSGGLVAGTTYYYAVRAEDATPGGGGPCRNGIEETNSVRKSGSPQGALVPVTFSDDAEGAAKMTMGSLWSISGTRAHAGTKSYFANGAPLSTCAALTTPLLVLGPGGSPSVLSFFSWRDNLESTFDGGVVEISTDNGGSWTKLPLTPTYPATFVSDSGSCANTPQAPANAGFTGNDTAWQGPYSVNLSAYANQAALIRFDMGTDPGVGSTGWYIDDIQITNASQPTPCSTAAASVPEVSSIASGQPLLITRSGGSLVLRYQEIAGAGGYNVYEGPLGTWYGHAASATNVCGAVAPPVSGRRQTVLTPAAGNRYYLVTAYTSAEGPSGFASSGEIPPAASTCVP